MVPKKETLKLPTINAKENPKAPNREQGGRPSKQQHGGESTCSHSSSSTRWAPIQTTTWRGVDLFSFFLINQVGTYPNNNMEGSRLVLILPHQPGRSPKFSKVLKNS